MAIPVPQYSYHIYDSVTDVYQMTLPLSGVSFSNTINGGGSFTATLSVADPIFQSGEIPWQDSTEPYLRHSIWVERNGMIVWGGFLTGRSYQASSQTVTLTGVTFEVYGSLRPQRNPNKYTNVDILTVARNMWRLQEANSNEPHWVYDTNLSGNKVTLTTGWWQEISNYIDNLVALTPGIEYYIDTYYDPAIILPTVRKKFLVASPTLPATDVGLTVSMNPTGGNMIDYTLTEDGSKFATKVYELGSGSDSAQLWGTYFNNALLDQGYMDVALTFSASDITKSATLVNMAKQQALKIASKLLSFSVTVKPDESFNLNNVKLGRLVTLQITDPRFPNGYTNTFRITTYTVNPGDNGEETIQATLEQIYNG